MRKFILITFFTLPGLSETVGQEFSGTAVFGGLGFGFSENALADGIGVNFSMGYQRTINERFRLISSLSSGAYSGDGVLDAPDSYFSSSSLKLNLNFDVIRIKRFSAFIGSGMALNYSDGLVGTGGDPQRSSSFYFNEWNGAIAALMGLRVNPEHIPFAWELLLLDAIFNQEEFFNLTFLRFRMFVKLNKKI